MRYIVLSLTSLLCALLTGAVFTQVQIFGIQPDIILAVLIAMVLLEKTMTPVFYMVGGAVVLDVLFAPGVGFYSLPYLIAGLLVYLFSIRRDVSKWYIAAAAGGILWVVKDLCTILFSVLLGNSFDIGKNLLHSTLPGILVAALLTYLVYLGFSKLYMYNFLRPVSIRSDDDYHF